MNTPLTTSLVFLIASSCPGSLAIGDLALVGWDSTAQGGLSYVALSDIGPGETIFFTDNEPNSGGTGFLDDREGTLQFETGPDTIKAGSVILFTDPTGMQRASNYGTLMEAESRFALSPSRDGLWVYQTADGAHSGPVSTWISATASTAGFGSSDVGDIPAGSGLVSGINALNNTPNDNIFVYSGDRSIPRTREEWLLELSNPANFSVSSSATGGSTASFSMVPEPGTVVPLAALLAPWFLRRVRRR